MSDKPLGNPPACIDIAANGCIAKKPRQGLSDGAEFTKAVARVCGDRKASEKRIMRGLHGFA
jgi:hypothetical protein